MAKFQVLLNGKYFIPKDPSYPERMGFYTMVFLQSNNMQSAKVDSIQFLLEDQELISLFGKEQIVKNNFKVNEVKQIDGWEGEQNDHRLGLSIYPIEWNQNAT